MHTRFDEDDAARALIERRWFSFELHRAANRLREECESLAEVLQATQEAWHDARSRLAELEAMRAALGEELARTDACCPVPPVNPQSSMVSAA
jgi:hypothetical protein